MAENFQNFYVTKLREACDAVATTIYVDTVPAITEGTLVLEYANSTKHEIIHFTGISGYGLTGCTRGLEGTTAQSHSAGTDVRQNLTAGIIDKIINGVITTENIADGAVTSDKIDFTTLSGNYSTSEVETGFTWIDGTKIYKKTVEASVTSRGFTIQHGISNLGVFVAVEGFWNSGGSNFQPITRNAADQVNHQYDVGIGDFNLSTMRFTLGSGMNPSGTVYITLYYTKSSAS